MVPSSEELVVEVTPSEVGLVEEDEVEVSSVMVVEEVSVVKVTSDVWVSVVWVSVVSVEAVCVSLFVPLELVWSFVTLPSLPAISMVSHSPCTVVSTP